MQTLWLISAFILVVVYIFDRKVLQFDPTAFRKFFIILLIGSALSIVLNSLAGRFPDFPQIGFGSLFMVFWEDVIFSLLLIYYAEKLLPRWLFVPVAIVSSIIFGLGHVYQGYFIAALISFYPYFVSYKFGKKYGYATIMICHVVYDLMIVGNTHLAQYLHNLIN